MNDIQKGSTSYPNPAASSPRGQQQPQHDTRPPSNEIGKEHELLKKTVGRFKVESTVTCDGKDSLCKGEAIREMILDGRFLHERFKGDFAGNPFEGSLLIGFADGEFQISWADNTSNRIFIARGGFVENSVSDFEVCTPEPYKDIATGRLKTTRERYCIRSADEILFEAYDKYLDEGQQEKRTLRSVYRRM